MMVNFIENSQGRLEIQGFDDTGFDRNNTHFSGIRAYRGCLWEIIARILSIFGKTVKIDIVDATDLTKKSQVWVNINSIKNLVARNAAGEIELPPGFDSQTIQNLIDNLIKKREQWIPTIEGRDDLPLTGRDMEPVKKFFEELRNNNYFDVETREKMKANLMRLHPHSPKVKFLNVLRVGRFDCQFDRDEKRFDFISGFFEKFNSANQELKKQMLKNFDTQVLRILSSFVVEFYEKLDCIPGFIYGIVYSLCLEYLSIKERQDIEKTLNGYISFAKTLEKAEYYYPAEVTKENEKPFHQKAIKKISEFGLYLFREDKKLFIALAKKNEDENEEKISDEDTAKYVKKMFEGLRISLEEIKKA
jgi:hypothetical protein